MSPETCIKRLETAVLNGSHPPPPDPAQFSPTSVIALFTFDDTPNLLFIQKADREGYPWANQMAFPGGHVDQRDASPRATALRELKEEMNIEQDNVRVLGNIGHFQTLNNKDIKAYTGIWNQNDTIHFDPYEISRVIKIPFDLLVDIHREKGYAGRRPGIMELAYPFQDVLIWGVTAKILHHLIELVREFRE